VSWVSHGKFGHAFCCSQIVLCLLREDQKKNCVDVSKEHINRINVDEIFIKNIVTGDETWVHSYIIETKAQYSHWVSKTSPRHNKTRQVWSYVKVMLTVFLIVRA
jgi:hypothetical protein